MESVKTALQRFFFGIHETEEEEETATTCCKVCSIETPSNVSLLSEEVLSVVQVALLVLPKSNDLEEMSKVNKCCLWVCTDCQAELEKLRSLFHQLEEYRSQFNYLRRKVGREVIVGSLGRSEEEWEGFFQEEIKPYEDFYPSACFLRMEEESTGEELADCKLSQMTPKVVLEEMDDQTGDQRKVWESLWVENSPGKKTMEVNDLRKTEMVGSRGHETREEQSQEEVVLPVEGDNVEFDGEIYDFVPAEEDEGESGQVQDPVERSRSSSSSSSSTSSSSSSCSCSSSEDDDPKKKVLLKKEAKLEMTSPSESEHSDWEAGKFQLKTKTKKRLTKKRPALVFSDEESSSASASSSSTSSTASTRLEKRKRSLRSSQALEKKKKLRASLSKIHSRLRFGRSRSPFRRRSLSDHESFEHCSICDRMHERKRMSRCKDKQGGPYKCFYCDSLFAYSHGRTRHIKNIHKGMSWEKDEDMDNSTLSQGRSNCTTNGDEDGKIKSKITKRDLVMSPDKPYSCSICSKRYAKDHEASRCKDRDNGPYYCKKCDVTFVYLKSKKRHMLRLH